MMEEGPSIGRLFGAAILASMAAAAPTILLGVIALVAFPIGCIIAFLHVLALGLPAYLLLRRLRRVDWTECLAAGVAIGAVPTFAFGGLFALLGGVDGGVAGAAISALIAGGCGLLGGAVFRAVAGVSDRTPRIDAAIFQ
jgi:hypothetical protein